LLHEQESTELTGFCRRAFLWHGLTSSDLWSIFAFTVTQTKFVSEALSSLNAKLAEEIRAARAAADLTQAELAKRLGVSTRSLQEWEAGRSLPRAEHRRTIARFLEKAAA
jgi:DNA-binding transcriptional regulator YiaG